MTEQDIQRFWSKVDKNGPVPTHRPELGNCWVWNGPHRKGYGYFTISLKRFNAHRISWIISNGPIPQSIIICHHCDNPACVNPHHLFCGTPKANSDDKLSKGRQAKGEKCGGAKLREQDITSICSLYASGNYTKKDIAELFGTDRTNVANIISGFTWKHVNAPRAQNEQHWMKAFPNRIPRGNNHYCHKSPELIKRGQDHSYAKLNDSDVIEIRRLFAAGNYTKRAISKMFSVTESQIGNIIHRRQWTHI